VLLLTRLTVGITVFQVEDIVADGVMTGHTHKAGNVPSLFQSIYYFLWGLEKALLTHNFDVMTRLW